MQNTQNTEPRLLDAVEEGMEVVDAGENRIGTVKAVRSGDQDPLNPTAETVSHEAQPHDDFLQGLARTFGPDTRLPVEIQKRMWRAGYIHVDAGVLSSDRIVLHEQIARVTDERVTLNVEEDELIKV